MVHYRDPVQHVIYMIHLKCVLHSLEQTIYYFVQNEETRKRNIVIYFVDNVRSFCFLVISVRMECCLFKACMDAH